MKYERLTEWISGVPAIKTYTGSYMTPFDSDVYDAIKRLAELEDKIEQGTLIEFPRMFKAIDRTGWIVEFIDESDCVCRNHFFHEERAIKRLKELQNG